MKIELKKKAAPQSGKPGCTGSAKKAVTVLHVDDDPNDTALLRVACEKAKVDFELQNMGDGEQVIAYLSGAGRYADRTLYQLPGLVLLDLKMPQATGFDVLKWIRNHSTLNRLPVVVLSGSELQEDKRHAREVGADSYLVKPLSFDALVTMVKNLETRFPAAGLDSTRDIPPGPGS